MDKLKLAHDYAMQLVASPDYNDDMSLVEFVDHVWKYADAMQAEAEKREDKTRPKALLTKDKDGKCLHFNHEFGHKKCMDCGASLEEWQPDWSQAPDEANTITIDACGVGQYWVMYQGNEPKLGDNRWFDDYRGRYLGGFEPVGFNGNWKDSLRKRPQ